MGNAVCGWNVDSVRPQFIRESESKLSERSSSSLRRDDPNYNKPDQVRHNGNQEVLE